MRQSKKFTLQRVALFAVTCLLGMYSTEASALDVDFHGYLESNIVMRDTDGFESGFMNHLEAIQQRTTLKFDLDVNLNYPIGAVSLDKAHLTYRGAYDTIFNIRDDEYADIPSKRGEGRFDYGLDDIKTENDLREASVDFTYQGDLGSAFFRPGRQMVSWGESTAKNLCDVVNPADVSFTLSAFPDELKTPLWMARFVYNIPPQTNWGLNFDLVFVPDVRPTQLGPLDIDLTKDYMSAPYIRNTQLAQIAHTPTGQGFLGLVQDQQIKEDVDSGRPEYGGRVTAELGENTSISGVYYRGIYDNPSLEIRNPAGLFAPMFGGPSGEGLIVHPWMTTYGGYFSSYISPPLDLVFKGEFAKSCDIPVARNFQMSDIWFDNANPFAATTAKVYETTDQYSYMLGFDRNFWARWLSSSQVQTSFQWIRTHTANFEEYMAVNQNVDLLSAQILWFWWNGRITPMVFCVYDTQGTWMTDVVVPWTITSHWKTELNILGFWGNEFDVNDVRDQKSDFAPLVNTSCQVLFKVMYQW